jgi:Holliday junction DNA helicase RuvA
MIAHLRGNLAVKSLEQVIVDVGGVGYSVVVSATTLAKLPKQGEQAFLHIHTHNHERGMDLFGFHSTGERSVFRLLLGITGVGPRLAIGILSAVEVDELVGAVASEDVRRLTRIPGVGKKTAQRMLVELRESLSKLDIGVQPAPVGAAAGQPAPAGGAGGGSTTGEISLRARLDNVHSALCNMGYKPGVVDKAMRELRGKKGAGDRSLEELLKDALKLLAKPSGAR